MTDSPYGPSYPPNYPPPGYGQTGYPPPGYGQIGYPPPGYGQMGHPPPAGYGSAPTGGRGSSRPLLVAWIACVGAAVICVVLCVVISVQWLQTASRIAVPENSTATYGMVVSTQGPLVVVRVAPGTPMLARSTDHTFGQTRSRTSITHAGDEFTAMVAGAPPLQHDATVSFSFSGNTDQSRYLAVAPSRIRAATKVPSTMVASILVGIVFGLVGVILLIVWIVRLRRPRYGR